MPDWVMRRPVWAAAAAAAIVVVVLVAGVGAGMLAARLKRPPAQAAGAAVAQATPQPGPAAGSPGPSAWWKPLPTASASFVPAELVIERLHVQAAVEVKGIDAHNVMEAPDTGSDAAWYQFTARPGAGSNAVFAGHYDFGRLGNPAIFWHLDQLVTGDLIDVVSPQHTEIRYRVTHTWDYDVHTIPMASVLATDRADEVTLITCAGTYDSGLGYDHRWVVRAVRTD